MGVQLKKAVSLALFVLFAGSMPAPAIAAPLFDFSAQAKAIAAHQSDHPTAQPSTVSTSFDSVTNIAHFNLVIASLTIEHYQDEARALISAQHAMIRLLLPLMHMVMAYNRHWQEQLYHPYAYFLSQPPHKWFGKKSQKEDIQDAITVLEKIERILAEHIGTLKKNIDAYTTITTSDELQTVVEDQHNFLPSFFGHTPDTDCNKNIAIIIDGFKEYHESTQKLLNLYKPAGHLSRNWIAYSTAAVCATAAACWYFKNPEANKAWIQSIIDKRMQEASNFWQEYIIKPIKRGYSELFYPKKSPHIYNQDTIQDHIDNTRAAVVIFPERNVPLSSTAFYSDYLALEQNMKSNPEKTPALVENFMKDHEFEMRHIARILGYKGYFISSFNPIEMINKAAALGRLEVGFEITNLKDGVNRASDAIDHIYEMFQGITPILVMIPVMGVGYISWAAAKTAYHKIAPHKVAHKGILKNLLYVEELLNDNIDQPTLDLIPLGIFTYHLGMLYTYAQDLSSQESFEFNKDITKLSSPSRSIVQKLKDIEIIRKKYQFLA